VRHCDDKGITKIKRSKKVKLALPTSGDDINAPLDSRFGRAPKFLVYDLAGETYEVIGNQQNLNAAQGAGIQAAEAVARLGVEALVTGHCGPKAFRVLTAAGIRICHTDALTVAAALEQYRLGKLPESKAAEVEGHWA
jgi:predicted Fe-Mo cluster-binding NifX family protein